jgi:hypothetical protein
MRLRKTLLALVACFALTAVAASAAQATTQWTRGAEGSGPGTTITSETVKVSGGPFVLTSKVLGAEIKLTAEKVECTSTATCTISGAGESAGQLTFTNVKVDPSTCSASNPGGTIGTINTTALKDLIIMDPTAGSTTVFDKFEPTTGSARKRRI